MLEEVARGKRAKMVHAVAWDHTRALESLEAHGKAGGGRGKTTAHVPSQQELTKLHFRVDQQVAFFELRAINPKLYARLVSEKSKDGPEYSWEALLDSPDLIEGIMQEARESGEAKLVRYMSAPSRGEALAGKRKAELIETPEMMELRAQRELEKAQREAQRAYKQLMDQAAAKRKEAEQEGIPSANAEPAGGQERAHMVTAPARAGKRAAALQAAAAKRPRQ